ncbi:MAG: LssY C-terminal domain-containing protein [Desulfobulbaceae bacterium]|nr:LssY C-terminal domain-containing protein [Desulfobulbaceae bacterium]
MINDLINQLLPSIEHFRAGGYWLAFLAALSETTVGIGLIIPGSTIILLLGALSARGYFDTGDLIWFAVIGAIAGDNVNYYLGRKYGSKWLKDGFWLVKANHMDNAKHFLDAHGARSIFFGRFIPSVKEVVPFMAGSLRMSRKTFMLWNVLGGAGWGFVWVLAGYIFAQSLNLAQLWLSRAGLFFAFLLISGGILYLLKWLLARKGKQFLTMVISLCRSGKEAAINNEHMRPWLQKHQRIISFLQARFDTTRFSGLTLSLSVLGFVYVLALFAGVVEDLITSDPIIIADSRIANLFFVFRTAGLTTVFTWITLLGKSQVVLAFIFIAVVILRLWRKEYCTLPLVVAVAGSETFTYLGKLAFHRPRPELAVYAEHSYSFPSGHATIAVAFYGFAGYLLIRFCQSWNRKVNIFVSTIIIIMAIGASRIYLGVHYISDVWSGYLVGAMWLIIGVSFCEWISHGQGDGQALSPARGARPVSFLLVISAVLFYAGFAMNYHPPLAAAPSHGAVVVSESTDIFTSEKMRYTETLTGEKQEPINFIFLAGNDSRLVAALQQAGWILTDQENVSSFLRAVKALILQTPHPAAPISPSFWNGRIQDISFAQVAGPNWLSNARHVKIWRTNFSLKNGNTIYVAMVNANDGFKWGIVPRIVPDLDAERERLFQQLALTGKIDPGLKIQLVKPQIGENFMGDQFFTDGKAYVLSVR